MKIVCETCGAPLKYYDTVSRIVRTKGHITIYPYKQYEAEIIDGVVEGFITCDTIGFEDYPCELTMFRWRSENL